MKKGKKRAIYVADSETDPFEYGAEIAPFVWGVMSDNSYESFESTSDFIRYISEIDCICYAHNGGKFDWHFILDYIENGQDILIINGRISRFKIGKCEFRDSWNILPVPLAQMQKDVVDYSIFTKDKRHLPENKKIISDYLYNDCLYLLNYVNAFVDRYGTPLTQASAAMKVWEKMHPEFVPHDESGLIFNEFSRFYYGGRCQAFETGKIEKPIKLFDINSAYPFAMTFKHAISLTYSIGDCKTIENQDFVVVRGIARGCFPFRDEEGALRFPDDVSTRIYSVTGWEYNKALEYSAFDGEVLEHYVFDDQCDFSDYVYKFYNERKEAKLRNDSISDLLAKLLLNSLYGRFAMNPDNYRSFKKSDDVLDGWDFAGEFGSGGLISRELFDSEKKFYNVTTAASITGFVRAYLFECMQKSTGVVYCDTDSIFCESSDVETGNELGQWKLEDVFDGGAIAGKKLYTFYNNVGHKTASKGVRLTPDEIYDVCGGKTVTHNPIAPTFSYKKQPVYISRNIKMK